MTDRTDNDQLAQPRLPQNDEERYAKIDDLAAQALNMRLS